MMADMYSFGVLVYEFMHGRTPHGDANNLGALVRREVTATVIVLGSVIGLLFLGGKSLRGDTTWTFSGSTHAERPSLADLANLIQRHFILVGRLDVQKQYTFSVGVWARLASTSNNT